MGFFPVGNARKMKDFAAESRKRFERGQALVEYLMMSLMLLFLFTGMYKLLQSELKSYFAAAGRVILLAYY